jgi:hypothetical protein
VTGTMRETRTLKVGGLLRGYGVKLCICGKYYAGDACPACAEDDAEASGTNRKD